MAITKFSPKTPNENILLSFDLTNLLMSGEYLTSAIWTVELVKGIDLTPDTLLNGSVSLTNFVTSSFASGGVDGCTYNILVTAGTTNSQIFVMTGQIQIKASQ